MSAAPVPGYLQRLVAAALEEDLGPGDVTSAACLPALEACGFLIRAKAAGVLAGMDAAREVFRQVDPHVSFAAVVLDGRRLAPGDVLAEGEGAARSVLAAERTALNFLQQLSGVATLTTEFVSRVAHTNARIVDTRKTVPGLRWLQKQAVRAGGGLNHRLGLYDAVLIKNNHITVVGSVAGAVRAAQQRVGHMVKIEVEVRSLEELEEALAAGPDAVLLDNMTTEQMREAVRLTNGRAVLEASGGVTLDNVAAVAETGVGLISVGALTHSAPALDLHLVLWPAAERRGPEQESSVHSAN